MGADKVADAIGHGIDVAGSPGHSLGQHIALGVKDSGRQIASLAHHRGKRGVHQYRSLFVDNGNEPVPQYFQRNRINLSVIHGMDLDRRYMRPSPAAPATALHSRRRGTASPAAPRVVDSASSMMAGPSILKPSFRRYRSYTGTSRAPSPAGKNDPSAALQSPYLASGPVPANLDAPRPGPRAGDCDPPVH